MGRAAVPTRPPSSGAVVFYARARSNYNATKQASSPPGTPTNLQGRYQRDTDDLTSSDSEKIVPRLFFDTSSQSSTDTKVEHFSDSGKALVVKGSTQAAVFALALAKDIIEVFSDVPYVQILAQAVQQVIAISEEVTANKEKCAELVEKVSLYSKVVFDALLDLKKPCPELEKLKEDLEQISSVLDGIQKVLTTMVASNKSFIRRVLGREEVAQKLGEYDRKLDTSITLFQLKSSIVLRVNAKPSAILPAITAAPINDTSRPKYTRQYSKPSIMIGRDQEISEIVTTLIDSKACLCILGSGGVGKTSIALSAFYDDAVVEKYGENRFFVTCEAATSPDLLLGEIAYALRINTEDQRLLDTIKSRLDQKESSLVVLDNFETSWDPLETRSEAEDIVSTLGWYASVIVTMRGTQKPARCYDYDSITLLPLDSKAAESLFYAISKKTDQYASKLVSAVDCLPLAVTLLANLAAVEGETTESLWERWQEENTAMVENGRGRINSLDASIKMSLNSQSMASYPGALAFLGLLCLLPDGMSQDLLRVCITEFPEPLLVRKALSILRRNALVQEDNEHYLKVLNPIRLYTQSHHPPSPKIRSFLHSYYLKLALKMSELGRSDVSKLRQEAGNVHTVLCDAIQHSQDSALEGVVDAIFSFCQYCYVSGVGSARPLILAEKRLAVLEKSSPKDTPLLNVEPKKPLTLKKALHAFSGFGAKARPIDSKASTPSSPPSEISQMPLVALRADLLGCMGQLFSRQLEFNKAIEAFKAAQQLHIQVGDRGGQAYDLLNMGLAIHQGNIDNDEEDTGKEELFEQALKLQQEIGDFAQAENRFTRALALYQKSGDQVGQSQALIGIATSWLLRSRFPKALDFLTNAMKLREPFIFPDHIHLLGRVYIALEQWTNAREMLEKSLQLHDALGDTRGKLADHAYLARIELHAPPPRTKDNSHLSIERRENPHSYAVRIQNDFDRDAPHTWDPEAVSCEILLRYGQLQSAEACVSYKLVGQLERVGPLLSVAHARHLLGTIKLREGEEDEALEQFKAALALHIMCDNLQGQGDDINGICEALMRKGELHEASIRIQDALALHIKIGYLTGQGDDLYVQGCIYLAQGALQGAESSIRKALDLHRASGFIFGQGRDLATLSDILWQKKQSTVTSELPVSNTEQGLDTEGTVPETISEEDSDEVLEEAMKLFLQCRARGSIINA
ncbi:hypothetical protein BJ165DRAFT_1605833 [Panaeolus papilionaceus]|nr:hypothetical protein BJ165DRAFT_1605833 [Panaeolus papilionaceus]